jgi:hypothetical protein
MEKLFRQRWCHYIRSPHETKQCILKGKTLVEVRFA